MSLQQAPAPGARALIRDEEWIANNADVCQLGGWQLSCIGASETVRDRRAISLSQLEDVTLIDPEDHMRYFIGVLDALQDEFGDDEGVKADIFDQRLRTKAWVEDRTHEPRSVEERQLALPEAQEEAVSTRSSFDYIDG